MTPATNGSTDQRRTTRGPVLVTGASGFIGGHLVAALAARGEEVYGLDRRRAPEGLPVSQFFQVDLRDAESVATVLSAVRPEVVYHLAAQSSVVVAQAEPLASIDSNVAASGILAELAANVGTRRFVFFSTGGAMYGQATTPTISEADLPTPISVYGASKLAAEYLLEAIARRHAMELSVLRPGNVYGPGQDPHGESGVIAIFTERMLRNDPVTIYGDGSQVRDYVYVSDVVRAAMCAAEAEPALCHVSTGTPQTTLEVFETLARYCDYTQRPQMEPARLGEIQGVMLSPDRALDAWGWAPTVEFDEGVRSTVEWHLRHAPRPAVAR
jgi:UDP-glucose 4-epimerase